MGESFKREGYRPDIDGLRAIAILTVVAYHAGIPGFGGGFVGVDVFFVISGYLITRLLALEIRRTGTLSFRDFYARRVRRLLPALWLVVLLTLLASGLVFWGIGDSWKTGRSARWALGGMANVFFMRNTGGYFDGRSEEMPLLHLWSLGVEEQFYFLWPALLWMTSRGSSGRGLRGPWIFLGCVACLSLAYSDRLMGSGGATRAFYSVFPRAWELAIGGVLALSALGRGLSVGTDRARRAGAGAIGALGLGGIAASAFFFTSKTPFPGVFAIPATLGTALVIFSGTLAPEAVTARALATRPLVRIGLVSYGWYLWHWPLLAYSRIWNLGQPASLWIRVVCVLLALVLAEASLRWIETPFRKGALGRRPALRTIGFGAGVSAVLAGMATLTPRIETAMTRHALGRELAIRATEKSELGEGCFDENAIGTPRCDFEFGGGSRAPRIAVWGDSHAHSYFPMVAELAREKGWNATLYSNGGNPPLLPEIRAIDASNRPGKGDFQGAVLTDLARKLRDPSSGPVAVVLAARWVAYTGRTPISRNVEARFLGSATTEAGSLAELTREVRNSIEQIRKLGVARVAIVLPFGEYPNFILRCLRKGIRCEVPRAEMEAFRGPTVRAIRAAVDGDDRVKLIDPLPVLCGDRTCELVKDGVPAVIDDNHPTLEAVRKVGRENRAILEWLAQ